MTRRPSKLPMMAALLVAGVFAAMPSLLRAQGGTTQAPANARQAAPIDITGYWVAFVTEDWRFRMLTPPKGDYTRVPLSPEGRKTADAWNPAADEAAGNQCKAFGAAAIMRVPGRFHVTWLDDNTLGVESDAGMQTRALHFTPSSPPAERTWQGHSIAQWDNASKSMTVTTSNMRAGYLRWNGVPYSENATMTEYLDLAPLPDGGQLLIVTTTVQDPRFLDRPFVVSSHYKKERDGSKWNPTPCTSKW